MTDNTPLNADGELLNELRMLYARRISSNFSIAEYLLEMRQLILADRKKHELQARIDELVDMHRNIMDNPKWHSDAPDQAFAYGRVHRIIDERIAEIKAERANSN